MDRRMSFLYLIALGSVALCSAAAVTHEVGDSDGWKIPTNPTFYTTWAASNTFNPGDKLVFKWGGVHNVVEVTKDEYEKCAGTGVPQVTSPVTISLDATGPRHFICSVGPHCSLGQKLSITVGSSNSTTPAPPKSSAPVSLVTNALYAAIFATAIIFFTCK